MKINGKEVEFGCTFTIGKIEAEEATIDLPKLRKKEALENLTHIIDQTKGNSMWESHENFDANRIDYATTLYIFTRAELQAFIKQVKAGDIIG